MVSHDIRLLSLTLQVVDGFGAMGVLPFLGVECCLQVDVFFLQRKFTVLQYTAFILQLPYMRFQLLQLFAAVRLGFP